MLTKQALQRRNYIDKIINTTGLSILEFGAFDNPTFRREMGDSVWYIDYFSSDELKEMHNDNPRRNFDLLVDVDYVVKSHDFTADIEKKFDLLVANHVIEHVPDIIYWLQQLEQILNSQGKIFLSIPDRRYTFDYFRPVSLATQMIRAHREGLRRPDQWQLLEHFYYHQKVDPVKLWNGETPGKFAPRFSLARAMEMAERKKNDYNDAHCWVFTPESFKQCIADLKSAKLHGLSIVELEKTQKNSNEFRVILECC